MMAQQTATLYEPMTSSLNIHPPTHPHLLCIIQQGRTHRQAQPQAHTQTHESLLCDQFLSKKQNEKHRTGS